MFEKSNDDQKVNSTASFDISSTNEIVGILENGNMEEIKKMIKEENDNILNFVYEGNSILHFITSKNLNELLPLLISETKRKLGVSEFSGTFKKYVNMKNNEGNTALHYSVMNSNLEMFNILVENYADIQAVNFNSMNCLHIAAKNNQVAMIVLLIEKYHFDLEGRDNKGATALHWGCYSNSVEAVEFLLYYGANVNVADYEKLTPIHLAVNSGFVDIAKLLLIYLADISQKDNKGMTVLETIKIKHNKEMKDLLEYKSRFSFLEKKYASIAPNGKGKSRRKTYYFILLSICFILSEVYCIFFSFEKKTSFTYIGISVGISLLHLFVLMLLLCVKSEVPKSDKGLITMIDALNNKNETFCPYCRIVRSADTFHCHRCNECVVGYKFHSDWFSSDIGSRNKWLYRFFIGLSLINYAMILIIEIICFGKDEKITVLEKYTTYIYALKESICFVNIVTTIILCAAISAYIYFKIIKTEEKEEVNVSQMNGEYSKILVD